MAKSAGLEIDSQNGGIVANESLATNFKNIYVAGDVASYIDDKLGRQRIEHHDNAIVTGKLAGDNMAGGEDFQKKNALKNWITKYSILFQE